MTPGVLSTLLVWAAATTFTIALFAYSADLAAIADAAARPRQAARSARSAGTAAVRHRVPATVVKTPFFKPPRKTATPAC
jgi:hypothetical protein